MTPLKPGIFAPPPYHAQFCLRERGLIMVLWNSVAGMIICAFLALAIPGCAQDVTLLLDYQPCASDQYGAVECSLWWAGDQSYSVTLHREGELLKRGMQLHFPAMDSLGRLAFFYEFDIEEMSGEIQATLVDVNGDQQDDLLLDLIHTIGAGPHAGLEIHNPYCFLYDQQGWILSPYLDEAMHCIGDTEFHPVDVYRAYHLRGARPLGISLSSEEGAGVFIEPDEELVFSMIIEATGERVTLAAHREGLYLALRKGSVGGAQYEQLAEASPENKGYFYAEESWGFVRHSLLNLNFENDRYRITLWDNYTEQKLAAQGAEVVRDGIGVRIVPLSGEDGQSVVHTGQDQQGTLSYLNGLHSLLTIETEFGDNFQED